MSDSNLAEQYQRQSFPNDFALIDGVEMHRANGDRFQIPHQVLKRHVVPGHFVELRIDSTRFSVHEDAPEKCRCASCNGEATNPILRHEHPASLVPLPDQRVPSRGWGEDFWVQVLSRQDDYFVGAIDNPLVESRLHGLNLGDEICFHHDHILAVHHVHRQEMVLAMDDSELKELAAWLRTQAE